MTLKYTYSLKPEVPALYIKLSSWKIPEVWNSKLLMEMPTACLPFIFIILFIIILLIAEVSMPYTSLVVHALIYTFKFQWAKILIFS